MESTTEQGGTPRFDNADVRMAGVHSAGVHSINRFVMSVPALDEAERFYRAFGLDVRRQDTGLGLFTFGHPHQWGTVVAGAHKRLEYLSFGIYAQDMDAFRARIGAHGCGASPHAASDGSGLWLRDPDGVLVQLVVGPKVSPSEKPAPSSMRPAAPGKGAAPPRSAVEPVRPRRLSHVLRFSPDVPRLAAFYEKVIGLRLSDHSLDLIAFMHAPHGSDHHMLAFAKSSAPGLHHSSWEVGSIDEVGLGSEQMRTAGYQEGWGVGRHVIGSNYFYYVRDPWLGWAEYSFDIDYIPSDLEWRAADHPPEDSIYVWGPPMHPEFITNHEVAQ